MPQPPAAHADPRPDEDAVDLGPLSAMLFLALRRAEAAVLEDLHGGMHAEAMRAHAFATLAVLKRNPGLRQSQVSFALGIQRTNFVPLLDGLEARGLAERRAVPGDRRAKGLFLTRLGAETLARLEAKAQVHEARMRARLGAEDHHRLLALLHRLAVGAPDPEG